MNNPIVISVVTEKGGVGKTGATVNVASVIANMGYKCLVLDLDKQENATHYLDCICNNSNICDVLVNRLNPSKAIINTQIDNLDIIPSSYKLKDVPKQLNNSVGKYLRLNPIKQLPYDFIIIDCPPHLGSITKNALCVSDYVLIPVTVDEFGLKGYSRIVKEINYIKDNYNPYIKQLGAFINKFDNSSAHRELKTILKEQLGSLFFNSVIRYSKQFANSTFARIPAVVKYKKSILATDYKALTQEIINKINL